MKIAISNPVEPIKARRKLFSQAVLTGLTVLLLSGASLRAAEASALLPLAPPSVSTIPPNGDVNPYGVAFVPSTIHSGLTLNSGDILVSNFNNNQNLQGTGTTIVRITPRGEQSLFFQGNVPGLSAALAVLRDGIVVVGNLPTTDGTSATAGAGSLLFISPNGQLLGQVTDPNLINGPWGMAINEHEGGVQIFVSNVLTGVITRFDLRYLENGGLAILRAVIIGSGFNHRPDPAALELGPSGLAYDPVREILYVASSFDNAVYGIPEANETASNQGTGTLLFQDLVHLHGPLDLVIAPNGHLIVANSDGSNADPNQPSELVEFTTNGTFVAQQSVDPNNGGAFGLGLKLDGNALRLAAVDDNQNTLQLFNTAVKY